MKNIHKVFMLWLCMLIPLFTTAVPNYFEDYAARWYWADFINNSVGGGGSVGAKIEDDVLTVTFSAGFAPGSMIMGKVKRLDTNPQLPDMDLGFLENTEILVSIEDGWLSFSTTGSNYISSMNGVFVKQLGPLDLTNWIISPSATSVYPGCGEIAIEVDQSLHATPTVNLELWFDEIKLLGPIQSSIDEAKLSIDNLNFGGPSFRVKVIDEADPMQFDFSDYFQIDFSLECPATISFVGDCYLHRVSNRSVQLISDKESPEYQWFRNGELLAGENQRTLTTQRVGEYYVRLWDGSSYIFWPNKVYEYSNKLVVENILASQNQNLVICYQPRVAGYTDAGEIGIAPLSDVSEEVVYYDGLGRPIQKVYTASSVNQYDMVEPSGFDQYGRPTIKYLPYEIQQSNEGFLRENAINPSAYQSSEQYAYYQNAANTAHDQHPFAETQLGKSALDRIDFRGAPGTKWQPGQHAVAIDYAANNLADQVYILAYDGVSKTARITGIYQPGRLFKNIVTDENGYQTIEFRNLKDQILLIRRQVDQAATQWASTYNVYDVYDNLVIVASPELSRTFSTTTFPVQIDAVALNKWAYQYVFDKYQRVVEKKQPGSEWRYLIYDERDRLVLTQDGKLRPLNQWYFTKYDALNRPIITGIYTDGDTRQGMQDQVNDFYVDVEQGFGSWYEKRDQSTFGYTNESYPYELTGNDYHTVTYYDDYSFTQASNYAFQPDFQGQTAVAKPSSQITGAWLRVLGSDQPQWLTEVNYYDGKNQLIQKWQEQLNAVPLKESYSYDFTGNVVESVFTHGNYKMIESQEYDHGIRTTKVWNEVVQNGFGTGRVMIKENNYNGTDQLISMRLHSRNLGNPLQSVDYQYNIRGWLRTINGGTQFTNLNDVFGMELGYMSAGQFNGNIGRMDWKTVGGSITSSDQAFSYTYDGLNRLKMANYEGAGMNGYYDVGGPDNGVAYDLNGNTLLLTRKFDNVLVDHLSYEYNELNQLQNVTDLSNNGQLFNDVTDVANDDYSYDANGNMLRDLNKRIATTTYNELNLPATVTLNSGQSIEYFYDAEGRKLEKRASNGQATLYVGKFQYNLLNGQQVLDLIHHQEGTVKLNGTQSIYQYELEDHLGNVRAIIEESGNVVQRSDYYPFGSRFNGWAEGEESPFLFTGKELQQETGNYDFEVRTYDPLIGRYTSIDPLAESYKPISPYAYERNNPISIADSTRMEWLLGTSGNMSWKECDCDFTAQEVKVEGFASRLKKQPDAKKSSGKKAKKIKIKSKDKKKKDKKKKKKPAKEKVDKLGPIPDFKDPSRIFEVNPWDNFGIGMSNHWF